MNKQQLASKIWESANKMRSKIEANEYKDYILGFIFYKFLSDQEETFLKKDGYSDEDIKLEAVEKNDALVQYCQQELGYFISYDNLFSTWISKGRDFSVDNVRLALTAFERLICDSHKKVFDKIFNTLSTGLSKLGETTSNQTKAISDLIQLIKDIPMNGRQDYDVLGFIYEYLISNFAANAGKKAGEFYTPHEVSKLMSEIVASHLKNRQEIKIYDPTSGSGSLLITIGKSVSKYMKDPDKIMYYAQELKENTYNLTRMNLVMRGIKPDNIFTRCGDTLEADWPWFDDSDPSGTYKHMYVDAVVSNPPYSQHWDPANKDTDPRYRYGMAPKGKADYAFLLHDLYHLKHDGIMTIVLPHGVLFRGDALGGADGCGEGEGRIRRNLIENNNIEAIIGLPANIFFGTTIPTIIMVLRQKRRDEEGTDVLFVDASKGFTKVGKNNKLMASDIKRIADVLESRESIEKFSRLVSKQEIRNNGYNLNIPRYVDSSEEAESWDIYSTMFGGIPESEIEILKDYWSAFPQLRRTMFEANGTPYSSLKSDNIKSSIEESPDIKDFIRNWHEAFADFDDYLYKKLIEQMMKISISQSEEDITQNIFERVSGVPLIDKYQAYQHLSNSWTTISGDLEMLQTEGFDAAKKVDPNMVIKKKGDREEEIQNGWIGHIIPFELVQKTLLKAEYDKLQAKKMRLDEIVTQVAGIIDSIPEEERGDYLNDDNTAFVAKEFAIKLKEIYADVQSSELTVLTDYVALINAKASKADKLRYIADHPEFDWSCIEPGFPYAKSSVCAYINKLRAEYVFPENSLEFKLTLAEKLLNEEKIVKKEVRNLSDELHALTKETIENLSDDQVLELLRLKWIGPLCASLETMPYDAVSLLEKKVCVLGTKYSQTYQDIGKQINDSEKVLSEMIDELTGNEYDLKGLAEFKKMFGGNLK